MSIVRRLGWGLIVLGAIGTVLFPTWFRTYYNIDLGTYRIYDRQGGFRTISDVSLSPAAAPLRITLTGRGQIPDRAGAVDGATDFVMILHDGEQAAITEPVRITRSDLSGDIVPGGTVGIAMNAPLVETLDEARYGFRFQAGARQGVDLSFLDVDLTAHVAKADPRVRTVSWLMLAAGIVLLVIARLRSRASRASAPVADGH